MSRRSSQDFPGCNASGWAGGSLGVQEFKAVASETFLLWGFTATNIKHPSKTLDSRSLHGSKIEDKNRMGPTKHR